MYGQYPQQGWAGMGRIKRVTRGLIIIIIMCRVLGQRLHTLSSVGSVTVFIHCLSFKNSLNQRPVRTYYWGLRYKWIALFVLYFIYSELETSCIFCIVRLYHNQYCLLLEVCEKRDLPIVASLHFLRGFVGLLESTSL
jgi:hypothetical protein